MDDNVADRSRERGAGGRGGGAGEGGAREEFSYHDLQHTPPVGNKQPHPLNLHANPTTPLPRCFLLDDALMAA